ncbi:MAG: DUF4296 domain-containing protein [Bacteroidetes bacterium]|jgi:hypothetical protein|nr:DUF4296 domain-containing protein [Bacteroidota bacterium]
MHQLKLKKLLSILLLWLLLITGFVSCTANTDDDDGHNKQTALSETSRNNVPSQKMAVILADIHLAEAAHELRTKLGPDSTCLQPIPDYYGQIFALHGVTAQQFKQTYYWYLNNPAELETLYDEVIAKCLEREK